MSKRLDKLRNITEANRLLESRLLNEQGKAQGKPATDAQIEVKEVRTKGGKGLFATDNKTPNPNNPEWQKLTSAVMDAIKNPMIKKPITVTVRGGASSAGASEEYNQKLADDRGQAAMEYLTQNVGRQVDDINSNVKFKIMNGVVGGATKLNSPEALAQQNVVIGVPTLKTTTSGKITTAIATTDVDKTRASGDPKTAEELGLSLVAEVKLIRTKDGKIVPMNKDSFKAINDALDKFNMRLTKDHLNPGKNM